MANDLRDPNEQFTVDFAQLAREVAMDIFPLTDILNLHKLTEDEWFRICQNPRFKSMLEQMTNEWNAADNTEERVKIKAATGLESTLEVYIRDIANENIPLGQRVEAGKFLARMGYLGEKTETGVPGGKFHITLNIGDVRHEKDITPKRDTVTIEGSG